MEFGIRNSSFINSKLKIHKFKMREAHNSKFKTQNSKLKTLKWKYFL